MLRLGSGQCKGSLPRGEEPLDLCYIKLPFLDPKVNSSGGSLSPELCAKIEVTMPASWRGDTIRSEYAEWLKSYNWDYFLTSTFRQPRKEPYYALQSVWHELQDHFVARAFLVAEPHQSGDLHIHGLAAGIGAGWRPELALPWDIWQGLFKRFGRAKVEACNTQEAVTGYCAKYLLKQQSRCCDYYEIFGNKFAWHNGKDLTTA